MSNPMSHSKLVFTRLQLIDRNNNKLELKGWIKEGSTLREGLVELVRQYGGTVENTFNPDFAAYETKSILVTVNDVTVELKDWIQFYDGNGEMQVRFSYNGGQVWENADSTRITWENSEFIVRDDYGMNKELPNSLTTLDGFPGLNYSFIKPNDLNGVNLNNVNNVTVGGSGSHSDSVDAQTVLSLNDSNMKWIYGSYNPTTESTTLKLGEEELRFRAGDSFQYIQAKVEDYILSTTMNQPGFTAYVTQRIESAIKKSELDGIGTTLDAVILFQSFKNDAFSNQTDHGTLVYSVHDSYRKDRDEDAPYSGNLVGTPNLETQKVETNQFMKERTNEITKGSANFYLINCQIPTGELVGSISISGVAQMVTLSAILIPVTREIFQVAKRAPGNGIRLSIIEDIKGDKNRAGSKIPNLTQIDTKKQIVILDGVETNVIERPHILKCVKKNKARKEEFVSQEIQKQNKAKISKNKKQNKIRFKAAEKTNSMKECLKNTEIQIKRRESKIPKIKKVQRHLEKREHMTEVTENEINNPNKTKKNVTVLAPAFGRTVETIGKNSDIKKKDEKTLLKKTEPAELLPLSERIEPLVRRKIGNGSDQRQKEYSKPLIPLKLREKLIRLADKEEKRPSEILRRPLIAKPETFRRTEARRKNIRRVLIMDSPFASKRKRMSI